jgi:hypothetical protein
LIHDRPDPNQTPQSGRILNFEPRRRAGQQPPPMAPPPLAPPPGAADADPVDPLARFEEDDHAIDYRHRMLMNVIAVVIVAMLVGVGVWLADTIAAMQKAQDCVLQGRQNCAPIEVHATRH